MTRPFLALVACVVSAAAARANGLPPPPAGKKFVSSDHLITAAKAFPDHDFYLATFSAPKKVTFGPDDPVRIPGGRPRGPGGRVQFVAVARGAADKYPDADTLRSALLLGTVPGQAVAKREFEPITAIDAKDRRESVVVTHVVERIDATAGIVFRAADGEKAAPPGKAAPDPPGPRGGGVVAGLALAVAAVSAGVWLRRRGRG